MDAQEIEAMRLKMASKMAAIPAPKMSQKAMKKRLRQNEQMDKKNMEATLNILKARREEAVEDGDSKKKFHTLVIERSETDKFNMREKTRDLKRRMEIIKKNIPHCN